IALVTLTPWPQMLASVGRVVMAAGRHRSRWLAIWSVGGTAIRINVNMKTVVARGEIAKLWRDPESFIRVRQLNRADLLAHPVGIDGVHGDRLASGISCARTSYDDRGSQRHDVRSHLALSFWDRVS